jgi:hypothetical protein
VNYTELEELIQDMAQNGEDSFVSHINEFIRSAEDKAYEVMSGGLYFTVTASVSTVADQANYGVADGMPAGIADIRGIRLGETPGADLYTTGPVRSLLVKDYEFLAEAYQTDTIVTGVPKYYAVLTAFAGTTNNPEVTIQLAPTPDAIYTTEIQYQRKHTNDSITAGNTPGVASTDHTWLSVMLPDVLLYGALVQGYTYMKGEPDIMALYEKNFQENMLLLKNMVENRQTTDTYKANDEGGR